MPSEILPSTPKLLALLREADGLMAGVSPDDSLFAGLDLAQIHEAHGVAGRLQDRVIAVLSRLTIEMANREDES